VPFIVFLALSAPATSTLWVALILGAMVDLRSPRDAGTAIVLGPYALGYASAAYLVLTVRGLIMRRHWLSPIVMSVLACGLAELVVVAFFAVRGIYIVSEFSAGPELVHRMLSALYTGATAAGMSLLLGRMSGVFGFNDTSHRRFAGGRM